MKKLFILFLFFTLFLHTAFAYNVREDSQGRPLYAADRIKVKLSEVAAERLNLVLTEEGDFSNTGLNRLDNLFESIEVSKITLAHIPVLDKVWEQEHGFNRWYLLFVPIGTDIENTITDISRNEYIEHVNPEYLGYESATPNDPFFDECWGHNNNSVNGPGSGHVVGFDSHIEEAWDGSQGYGDPSIIIAIIDSGVDYNHEDLDDNCIAGYDYGDGDSDPMDDSSAPGHGTSCAGIAAAEVNNSIGVSGVAGNCSIMPLKAKTTSAQYPDTAVNNALIHCGNNNVDIMSTSLGFGIAQGDSPARDASIEYAYDHGVTLIACTANGNTSTITNPANDEHVIAVGAASPCAERKDLYSCDGQNWWGSNYGVNTQDAGDAVDVIAPTILPSTVVTGGYRMDFNGTSCATPYAAGVAALIKSKNPCLTPAQIRDVLTSTATDVQDEVVTPGWDRYTGYGMVNAGAAVGPNTWEGTISNSWYNASNWSFGHVPTACEDVLIPSGTPYSPIITAGTAYCNNLIIQSGATLTQNGTSYFYVFGNFDSDAGTFTQNGVSYLYFDGTSDNIWDDDNEDDTYQHVRIIKDDPTNYTFMWQDMTVEQSFEIREGELKIDNVWTLTVNGTATNAFEVESGGKLTLIDESVNVVNGDASFYSGSQADILGGSFSCGGDFNIYENASYNIQLNNCPLTMHGSGDQNLNIVDAGSFLYDLVIDKSVGSCLITGANLQVINDVVINNGIFDSNTFDIYLGNDWTNNVGDAGFIEGTGTVIFNGPGPDMQYIHTDESFSTIDNNTVQAIRINNISTIECDSYVWTSGSVSVVSGTFIANDLAQSGLYGNWYALTNSEIYLNQDTNSGSYIDVFSDVIHIHGGGLLKVIGGYDESYWCGGSTPLVLEIDDGTLDFDGPGIWIWNNAILTEAITDGTIRTSGWFTCDRTDFNLTAGEIELYGPDDANLSMAGSYFNDVRINKAATDVNTSKIAESGNNEIDITSLNKRRSDTANTNSRRNDRNGNVTELTRAQTVVVMSDLDINGDFTINSGIFNTNGYNMNVGGNWANNVGSSAFTEGTGTVFFDGPNDGDILTDEWFYDLTVDKSNGNFTALEAFENVNVIHDIHIIDGVLEMESTSNLIVGNNVTIEADAGLNANDAALNIYVGGSWTNYNTDYDTYHGFWHGYISTVIFNSGGDSYLTSSAPQEDFYNLTIYKSFDEFRPNDNIQVFGKLLLYDGEWNDNLSGLTHTFHGDFEVTSDAAWFTHVNANTVKFAGENDQEFIYDHFNVGYFRDVIIDKSPVDFAMSNGPDQPAIKNDREVTESRAQTLTMLTEMNIQLGGTLTIDEGTMEVNGNTLKGDGNITINSGGTLSLNSNSTLWLDDGAELAVNSGGTLEVIGTSGNLAAVTHRNSGYYDFYIYSGGTISAEYAIFEYMGHDGIYVSPNAVIDTNHHFDDCIFRNGIIELNAALLAIHTGDVLTIENVEFPTFNADGYNVSKGVDNGHLTFVDATGIFAGEFKEWDPFDLIDWTTGTLDPIDDLTITYNSVSEEIDLDWSAVSGATSYKIYRSTDPYDFSSATVFTRTSTDYSESDTGTNYFYYVTAVNGTENVSRTNNNSHSEVSPLGK